MKVSLDTLLKRRAAQINKVAHAKAKMDAAPPESKKQATKFYRSERAALQKIQKQIDNYK